MKPVVGIDTGGTFTDVVKIENGRLHTFKLSSTPGKFHEAVLNGAQTVHDSAEPFEFVHSSTVATNALLERKGAKTALICTHGFRDLLFLGRQNRPDLYALHPQAPEPWVARERCLEVKERVNAKGEVLTPLDEQALPALLDVLREQRVESVAVCLLFSFLYPDHEKRVGEALQELGIPVVLSHELLPEFREFERASTTVANAYVRPVMEAYLELLSTGARELGAEPLRIVQSNGGCLAPVRAGLEASRTLLSGPAAGMIGAVTMARASFGAEAPLKLVTFDMGGTSTDVSLVDGDVTISSDLELEGFPVQMPMVDVHTVGAGGGSIAHRDAGGALQVGPESAGADPGPAFYGKSKRVAVSDANLFLNRLRPELFLGGRLDLDLDNSREAICCLAQELNQSPEDCARDILKLVNANMEQAIRVISVERGYDLRGFTLLGFGGAGGLHVFDLADSLEMPRVLIPNYAGVLSALGAAVSPVVLDATRTVMLSADSSAWTKLQETFASMHQRLQEQLVDDGFESGTAVSSGFVSSRYAGQSHELEVPLAETREATLNGFHAMHRQRYGHADHELPVEWVTLRAVLTLPKPDVQLARLTTRDAGEPEVMDGCLRRNALCAGDTLQGPLTILEEFTTTRVPAGWQVTVDAFGNLLGERV